MIHELLALRYRHYIFCFFALTSAISLPVCGSTDDAFTLGNITLMDGGCVQVVQAPPVYVTARLPAVLHMSRNDGNLF